MFLIDVMIYGVYTVGELTYYIYLNHLETR